jgi:type IV pilus assembly protein PilC
MAVFDYRGKDAAGKEVEGAVEADNEAVATELLRERNIKISSLQAQKRDLLSFKLTFLQRIKVKDIVIFSRQLSVMVGASVSLVRSIRTTARQTANPKLRRVLTDVADEVEGGVRLSDALAKYPKVFGSFYINMVRSGETSGQLDEVLLYLADQQEKDYDIRSRVKGAMTYPIFVLCMLFLVGAVMMIFVVPKLTGILRESGVELPISTRILIGVSDFFVNFWYIIVAGVIGLVAGTRAAYGTPAGKRVIDTFLLYIPVFGPMFRKIAIVRLTQGLSTLIAGGVDMVSSLKVVANVVGNEVYRDAILLTVQEVSAGNSITTVWKTRKEFPVMVTQMVSVGEETGKLQIVLERLNDFYTREINATVATLSTAIEPAIMVLMGLAVGGMVSAIILPMYSLAQQM